MSIIDPSRICYEDSTLLIYNKPAGLHSVTNSNQNSPSLAQALGVYCPGVLSASAKPEDGGLIHRLDFWTSGCLIAAKDSATWNALVTLRKAGRIKKSYRVLAQGTLESQTVDTFIGSPYRRGKKVKVYTSRPRSTNRVQAAVSEFKLISAYPDRNVSMVSVELRNGRRHQIRAHAAFLGNPLVGDELYGASTRLVDFLPDTERQFFLHAETLDFDHPHSARPISVAATQELSVLNTCF